MKRIFSIALISLSASILLLHSFVPHHHSPENLNLQEILKNEPVKSPIDLLKVGFYLNLGANHLENFQKNKSLVTENSSVDQQKVNLLIAIPVLKSSFSYLEENTDDLLPLSSKSTSTQFINSFSYRGPPFLA